MSNGEEYLLGELEREVRRRDKMHPDFSKCGIGPDFSESMHTGTTLLLKDALIRQRREVHKDRKSRVAGGVKLTGWGALVYGVAYLLLKSHGLLP